MVTIAVILLFALVALYDDGTGRTRFVIKEGRLIRRSTIWKPSKGDLR